MRLDPSVRLRRLLFIIASSVLPARYSSIDSSQVISSWLSGGSLLHIMIAVHLAYCELFILSDTIFYNSFRMNIIICSVTNRYLPIDLSHIRISRHLHHLILFVLIVSILIVIGLYITRSMDSTSVIY